MMRKADQVLASLVYSPPDDSRSLRLFVGQGLHVVRQSSPGRVGKLVEIVDDDEADISERRQSLDILNVRGSSCRQFRDGIAHTKASPCCFDGRGLSNSGWAFYDHATSRSAKAHQQLGVFRRFDECERRHAAGFEYFFE